MAVGFYQAVRWQQEPKQFYSHVPLTVSYKICLYSHVKCILQIIAGLECEPAQCGSSLYEVLACDAEEK
jgi:hypothetical protein